MLNRREALKYLTLAAAAIGLSTNTKESVLTTKYCLGKQPARPHVGLKFGDYVRPHQLPKPPENFGHENLVPDWQMLGNDSVGDCAIAGPFHALMLWNAMGKKTINVDTDCTLKAYSTITGYDPNDPSTDQGANVQEVAEYWRTQGLADTNGNSHKIDCYLSLEPKNTEQLYQAIWLFGAAGIGIKCPSEYQDAFARGQVWDRVKRPHIEGGHYILGVGSRAGLINTVTWGRTQLMTPAGYKQFNDETFVYLDEEMLINGVDIDGFNLRQLINDMKDMAEETVPEIAPVDCESLPLLAPITSSID